MHSIASRTALVDDDHQAILTSSGITTTVISPGDEQRFPVQKQAHRHPEGENGKGDVDSWTLNGERIVHLPTTLFGQHKVHVAKKSKNMGLTGGKQPKDIHRESCIIALREENERARLALKASTMPYCTSEQFDKVFPRSLRYISTAQVEEILNELWEEVGPRL